MSAFKTSRIERDWMTAAGFRAVVLMTTMGHRCGYVGLPVGHPLHGVNYSSAAPCLSFPAEEPIGKRGIIPLLCADGKASPDVVFDVHGGITYAEGKADYPAPSDGLWWFGYDCGHAGDSPCDEYIVEQREKYPDKPYMWRDSFDSEHRSLDYCIAECESLAQQMIDRVHKQGAPEYR